MRLDRSWLLARYLLGSVLTVVLLATSDATLTEDKELTSDLRASWYDENFVIVLKNIRTRRKHTTEAEPLLVVKYHAETNKKIMLMLDRRTREVILENLDSKERRAARRIALKNFNIHDHAPIKSMILSIHQKKLDPRMDVYINCAYQGSINMEESFRELAEDEDFLNVEAFRENKCKVRVYRGTPIEKVLRNEECHEDVVSMADRTHDRQTTGKDRLNLFENEDTNQKRKTLFPNDDESILPFEFDSKMIDRSNLSYEATIAKRRSPRRGDIGIQNVNEEICLTEAQIAKTLNELIQATRKVWMELEMNRKETHELRVLMENCAACHQGMVG